MVSVLLLNCQSDCVWRLQVTLVNSPRTFTQWNFTGSRERTIRNRSSWCFYFEGEHPLFLVCVTLLVSLTSRYMLPWQPVVTKVSPDLKQPTRSEPGSVRASDAAAGWRSSTGGWSDGAFRLRVVQLQTNRQISGVSQLVWHQSVRNVGGAYDWIFTGLHR